MHFNCDRTSTIESNPDVDFLPHFNVVYLTIIESRPMGVDPNWVRAGADEAKSLTHRLNGAAVSRKSCRDHRILFWWKATELLGRPLVYVAEHLSGFVNLTLGKKELCKRVPSFKVLVIAAETGDKMTVGRSRVGRILSK